MAKKQPPRELLEAVSPATVQYLSTMARIGVSADAGEVSAAIRQGAVLLAFARVDNDKEGHGFRFLIGIPNGVAITPFLDGI